MAVEAAGSLFVSIVASMKLTRVFAIPIALLTKKYIIGNFLLLL